MEIYKVAQDFMIASGNPDQWGHFYPDLDTVKNDIETGISYVIYDVSNGEENIHGVFVVATGAEPTYKIIDGGQWLNDSPYVTIHRMAGDGTVRGLFQIACDYSKGLCQNVRIDTHGDNRTMQKLIERNGFVKCGTIYVRDGSPRIAYQWAGTGGTVPLETERLRMRRHVSTDGELLHSLIGCDEEMHKYTGWNPYATAESALSMVQEFIESYSEEYFFGWAIELKDQEGAQAPELIGTIGAYDYSPEENSVEVGISIARKYWGRGYGHEALAAVLKYLTEDKGISLVKAWCAEGNVGSKNIMEKCGMKYASTDSENKLHYEYR